MKASCNGCKAYINGCWLGKKVKTENKFLLGINIGIQKPLEDCPKPKTNKELLLHINKT